MCKEFYSEDLQERNRFGLMVSFIFKAMTNIRVREINFILPNNTTDFTALIFTKLTVTQYISVEISCTEYVQMGRKV
jgi:hypothetical protein